MFPTWWTSRQVASVLAIQDPLNSTQTTDLSIFGTLGDLLAACTTRVRSDACTKLFAGFHASRRGNADRHIDCGGGYCTTSLEQARDIVCTPERLLSCPRGPGSRAAPFRPYLLFAPSTWTIALRYAGGGLAGLGGIAIDSEGNAWAADNQMAGSQSTMFGGIGGTLSELAPDGRPISPMTTGYTGGGVDFPGWGLTIAGDGKVWVTSIEGKTISVFDHTGKPLSPPTGYNFNGQLGSMQGITATPNGDVWAVDALKNQIAYFPKGDPAQARLLCRTVDGKPADGTCQVKGPFHVAIDQQGRILVSNANSDTVTRFPANDPSHAEQLKVGYSPHAIAIDSQGNAWVANTMGDPSKREMLALLWNKVKKSWTPIARVTKR